MSNGWRRLMRRVLTPNVSETLLDTRGFNRKSPAATETLETVGAMFLEGYGTAVETRTPAELAARLDEIPTRYRGFAYEGAGMGYGVLDALPIPGKDRNDTFLATTGDPHIYMVYVGVGWAMARTPRFTWPKFDRYDTLLRWLILDGYGFHQTYFHTRKYAHEQYVDPNFGWPGKQASPAIAAYANRAIDQGIGRAMWFVAGTDPDELAKLFVPFAEHRKTDLWAGAGLAATYAGGGDADELRRLVDHAGEYVGALAQGSAFAAEARVRADLVVPHNELATRIICGLSVEQAARITLDVKPENPVDGELPAFELWRQRIATEVMNLGGVGK